MTTINDVAEQPVTAGHSRLKTLFFRLALALRTIAAMIGLKP
jgi:hypothetical protein